MFKILYQLFLNIYWRKTLIVSKSFILKQFFELPCALILYNSLWNLFYSSLRKHLMKTQLNKEKYMTAEISSHFDFSYLIENWKTSEEDSITGFDSGRNSGIFPALDILEPLELRKDCWCTSSTSFWKAWSSDRSIGANL